MAGGHGKPCDMTHAITWQETNDGASREQSQAGLGYAEAQPILGETNVPYLKAWVVVCVHISFPAIGMAGYQCLMPNGITMRNVRPGGQMAQAWMMG